MEEKRRWFNNTIKPQTIKDKDGNALSERGVVANAFWPKKERCIEIKPLSDKHPKVRKKEYGKAFE